MTAVSYIPGTWLGIVRSRTAVLMGPETRPELITALWDLLEGSPEVHEVLHAVTSSSGGSLANIPSFGILDFHGPLRVFLRGDLDATVLPPEGAVELNGRDVTTWTERRFNQSGLCRLAIPAAGGGPHPQPTSPHAYLPELPLGEGVVLLQSLVLTLDAGAKAAAGPDPAARIEAAPHPAAEAAAPVIGISSAAAVVSAVPAQATASERAVDLPEDTAASEHGASAETMYAVIDEDFDVEGLAGTGTDPGTGTDLGTDSGPVAGDDHSAVQDDDVSGEGEQVAVAEMTSSYDHLWERTVVRRIEDAAIREEPEAAGTEHSNHEAERQEAADQREEAAPPAHPGSEESPVTADAPPAVVLEAPSAGSPGPAPVGPASSGLIDSVPWRTAAAGSEPVTPPAVLRPTLPAVPAAATAAPVAPAPVAPAPEAIHAEYDADHDGQTVMKGSLKGVAAQPVHRVTNGSAAAGPLVLARLCPQDHANPPTSALCAACGAGLLPDAVQVARPRLGRMRISTGELVDLDQSVVIGRQPSVSRVQGGVMPRLVQVASPGGDISRSHVEVRLEGWHVMLCDLKATNGTVLVREGQPPRRLAQNEMAILLDGDIAELGDNISLRFEEIP